MAPGTGTPEPGGLTIMATARRGAADRHVGAAGRDRRSRGLAAVRPRRGDRFRRQPGGARFQDDFRLRCIPGAWATHGQNCGRRQDQAAAHPGVRAKMLAQQLDAQQGAKRRFEVQEDSGARGRHMMNTPVPQQRGGSRAQQAADGQRDPGGEADVRRRAAARPSNASQGFNSRGPRIQTASISVPERMV